MARSRFGGTVGDQVVGLFDLGTTGRGPMALTLPRDANGDPTTVVLSVWDEPDGTQLTDLSLDAAGTEPISTVSVPPSGQIPIFYGPNGVTELYVKDPDGDYYLFATGPAGTPGTPGDDGTFADTWRGAWSNVTAYAAGDLIKSGGAVWLALAGSTNVTPVEGATWTKVVDKGTDGAGSGDVVGAGASVAGNIPYYGDTSGDLIGDSGIAAADLVRAIALNVKIVRAATTGNITLSGAQTIDGVSVVAGDPVLVKDESTGANNGVYVAAAGSWARASWADSATELAAAIVLVLSGIANGGKRFGTSFKSTDTLGTTAMAWSPLPNLTETDARYAAKEVYVTGLATTGTATIDGSNGEGVYESATLTGPVTLAVTNIPATGPFIVEWRSVQHASAAKTITPPSGTAMGTFTATPGVGKAISVFIEYVNGASCRYWMSLS